ncbi:MAG TPA: ferredoxin [Methanomassiliicoccales archaeon]|jgi:ferredoxin
MVSLRIDEKVCSGCGICYGDECPELFVEGDNGISEILPSFQKGSKSIGDIPADKAASAKSAAMACPNNAITIG